VALRVIRRKIKGIISDTIFHFEKKDKKEVSGNIKVWPSNTVFAALNRKIN